MQKPYDLLKTIRANVNEPGFHLSKLKPGTIVEVNTQNTLYTIQVLEGGKIQIQGGNLFPEKTKTGFCGSTWGGSAIKVDWIGKEMCMEILQPGKKQHILTTGVQHVKIKGDDWEYKLF